MCRFSPEQKQTCRSIALDLPLFAAYIFDNMETAATISVIVDVLSVQATPDRGNLCTFHFSTSVPVHSVHPLELPMRVFMLLFAIVASLSTITSTTASAPAPVLQQESASMPAVINSRDTKAHSKGLRGPPLTAADEERHIVYGESIASMMKGITSRLSKFFRVPQTKKKWRAMIDAIKSVLNLIKDKLKNKWDQLKFNKFRFYKTR